MTMTDQTTAAEPLDIFTVAAERLGAARQRYHNAAIVQWSPATGVEYHLAKAELDAARDDMERVADLVVSLGAEDQL